MKNIGLTLALLPILLISCTSNKVYNSTTALSPPLNASVIILPPDFEISSLNAGGNREPQADWTAAAKSGFIAALEEFFFDRGVRPIPYGLENLSDEDVDLIRQANINLDAIELAQARGSMPGTREYSISDNLIAPLEKYDADYAIFAMIRSSHATGGRVAVAIIAGIGGVPVATGSASYRVALFDLRDGQVAWANFDPVALGGLGNPAEASNEQWQRSFETLFQDFPL